MHVPIVLKALSCWRGLGEEKSNQSFLQNALKELRDKRTIEFHAVYLPLTQPSPFGEGLRATTHLHARFVCKFGADSR